ncbi:DUF4362 domain-containing protein [Actinoplanes sp. NPDC026623]|uniref:DUF4362 domain-containing protein n=1 Tax=Actinoplanes sp. NPDC026623 TaxID=3155610 RepID=UPI0033F00767
MGRILVLLAASLALAACTGSAPVPEPAVDTDCGTFDVPLGQTLPESATRCLVEAVRAERSARLRETRYTDEGDPVPVTYTAGAGGRVEVVTDSRQDAFGERNVTSQTCTGLSVDAGQLSFADCSEPTPTRG